MSEVIDQYQKLADKARSDAATASLPKVRELHLRSAERLDELISGLEKVRNEEAKRNAIVPYPSGFVPGDCAMLDSLETRGRGDRVCGC